MSAARRALRALWRWLTHSRCEMCREVKVERAACGGVCIYCRDCAPEFYDAG